MVSVACSRLSCLVLSCLVYSALNRPVVFLPCVLSSVSHGHCDLVLSRLSCTSSPCSFTLSALAPVSHGECDLLCLVWSCLVLSSLFWTSAPCRLYFVYSVFCASRSVLPALLFCLVLSCLMLPAVQILAANSNTCLYCHLCLALFVWGVFLSAF